MHNHFSALHDAHRISCWFLKRLANFQIPICSLELVLNYEWFFHRLNFRINVQYETLLISELMCPNVQILIGIRIELVAELVVKPCSIGILTLLQMSILQIFSLSKLDSRVFYCTYILGHAIYVYENGTCIVWNHIPWTTIITWLSSTSICYWKLLKFAVTVPPRWKFPTTHNRIPAPPFCGG